MTQGKTLMTTVTETHVETTLEDTDQRGDTENVDMSIIIRHFKDDVKKLAREYISRFFEGKEMYCGGNISSRTIHAPGYVSLVIRTDVGRAVDQAYQAMRQSSIIDSDADENNISEDMRTVLKILQECSALQVPKRFAGGIILMYLELCMGVDIDPKSYARTGF